MMTGVTLLGELTIHNAQAAQLPRKAKAGLEESLRLGGCQAPISNQKEGEQGGVEDLFL